jgi:hypothetical protein
LSEIEEVEEVEEVVEEEEVVEDIIWRWKVGELFPL